MQRPPNMSSFLGSPLTRSTNVSPIRSPQNANTTSYSSLYNHIRQVSELKKSEVSPSFAAETRESVTRLRESSLGPKGYGPVNSTFYKSQNQQLPVLQQSISTNQLSNRRQGLSNESPELKRLKINFSATQLQPIQQKTVGSRQPTPNLYNNEPLEPRIIKRFERQPTLAARSLEKYRYKENNQQQENSDMRQIDLSHNRFTITNDEEFKSIKDSSNERNTFGTGKIFSETRRSIPRSMRSGQTTLANFTQGEMRDTSTNLPEGANTLNSRVGSLVFQAEDFNIVQDEQVYETESHRVKVLKLTKSVSDCKERKYLQARRLRLNILGQNSSDVDEFSTKSREFREATPIFQNDPIPVPKEKKETTKPRKPKIIKLERDRTQVPNIKKLKEIRRLEIRRKLRVLLWGIAYPKLLIREIETEVKKRKRAINRVVFGNIETNIWDTETYLMTGGEKYLRELVSEHKSLELFSPNKPIVDKVLDVRINFIVVMENIRSLFEKLTERTTKEHVSLNFLKFLACISENSGLFAGKLMFGFEIKKVQITKYGTLRNMSPQKSKLILGSFILMRVLIHRVILKPWKVFPSLRKDKVNKQNLLIIASILYYTIMNYFKKIAGIQFDHQTLANLQMQAKPKADIEAEPYSHSDKKDAKKHRKNNLEDYFEDVGDFIPKEQLQAFFTNRKTIYEQLKPLIEDWHDKIYELVHTSYLEILHEESKTYAAAKMDT